MTVELTTITDNTVTTSIEEFTELPRPGDFVRRSGIDFRVFRVTHVPASEEAEFIAAIQAEKVG